MPNDSGQLWSGSMQFGREVTAGTPVAATRVMYFEEPMLSIERDPRVHRFMTGTRDNVRAYTNGPIAAAGSVSCPMSAEECLELFLISVQGAVTPTTPSGATLARLWTFKPAGALDSATIEWADGARTWQGAGNRGDTLTIQGATAEDNKVSVDLFGTSLIGGSLTGALSQRTPTFMEGWQSRLYIDPFAATVPGQTPMPGLLRNWNIQIKNGLDRVYTSDNTLAANRITSGELDVTATLTFDAFPTQALTEYNNWGAGTQRMVSVQFLGPEAGIEAGANEVQTIATTGTPTGGNFVSSVLGQQFTLVFNSTNAQAQTAINNALAVLGTGHTVTVTAGPLPAALTITFDGAQVSQRDIPTISLVTNGLTGGTTPVPVYATTTPGRSGRREVNFDLPGAWTAVNLGGNANGIRTYEFSLQAVYQTTLASMAQIRVQTDRTTAF